jgi:hypothetical protein
VDLDEASPLETPLNPLCFPNIPDISSYDDFTRFLGPNSIDDLFRPQLEHSADDLSPNMDSTAISLSQSFGSLDQYVSTLDLQNGYEPHDSNDTANYGSLYTFTRSGNVIFDDSRSGAGAFIPLSPYVMQMHSPGSSHLAPMEPEKVVVQ